MSSLRLPSLSCGETTLVEISCSRITLMESKGLEISIGIPAKADYVHQTQSGETRHSNDINVNEVQFLGQRGDSNGQGPDSAPEPEEFQGAGEDLELPF